MTEPDDPSSQQQTSTDPVDADPGDADPGDADPTEDAPTEDAPTEDAPTEDAPTEDAPVGTQAAPVPGWRTIREWLIVVAISIGTIVLVKNFLLTQYYIKGPSMQPTMVQNDRVFVNKLSYRLHDVNRGDVVVFDRITDDGDGGVQHDDLIKRVIGLGGETVEIRDCIVLIDERVLDEPYLDQDVLQRDDPYDRCRIPDLGPQFVPEGSVFVMGDNRPDSMDSREFGPIETDQIRGRAFAVVWPLSAWRWL